MNVPYNRLLYFGVMQARSRLSHSCQDVYCMLIFLGTQLVANFEIMQLIN